MDTLIQVKENLLFYNLWTQISEIKLPSVTLLRGIPKDPLLNDEEDTTTAIAYSTKSEIVLPWRMKDKLTPRTLATVFKEMQENQSRPKRIVIGIVNDDGTVVFYFVHDGVYKPKKN